MGKGNKKTPKLSPDMKRYNEVVHDVEVYDARISEKKNMILTVNSELAQLEKFRKKAIAYKKAMAVALGIIEETTMSEEVVVNETRPNAE